MKKYVIKFCLNKSFSQKFNKFITMFMINTDNRLLFQLHSVVCDTWSV